MRLAVAHAVACAFSLLCLFAMACHGCPPTPSQSDGASSDAGSSDAGSASTATIVNRSGVATTVYVSFGSNSQVTGWPFCADAGGGQCSFLLAPDAGQPLPTGGQPANVTLAFDKLVSCGASLAEFNFAIPGWSQDTANISLVNGWNHDVEIDVPGAATLGPTQGADANADVFGVYPVACDICVSRSAPPCSFDAGGCTAPGSCGCKSGTQYDPAVPCQESFTPGATVTVALVR